jgi:hypothetical protein
MGDEERHAQLPFAGHPVGKHFIEETIPMRNPIRISLGFIILAGLLVAGVSRGQEKAAPAKTLDLAPEMQKLGFLIGDWHYTNKFEKTKMMPDGGASEGTYRATIGPGGHSILTDFEEEAGPMAGSAGHEVITWDTAKSSFDAYAFVSDGPGCFTRAGTWEKDQLVFSREINAGGKTVRMRFVYTEAKPDAITIEVYMGVADGPLKLSFTTRARKT